VAWSLITVFDYVMQGETSARLRRVSASLKL
jgi:hypothetical protein